MLIFQKSLLLMSFLLGTSYGLDTRLGPDGKPTIRIHMPSLRDSCAYVPQAPGADATRLHHAIAPRFRYNASQLFVLAFRFWYDGAMSDITHTLESIQRGDRDAANDLLPLVYDELRALAAAKLSREKPGQTLQATALVHEAYMRLVGPDGDGQFDHQGHFFASAAEAMRRLLVERARRYKSQKRGSDWQQVELSEQDLVDVGTPDQIVAVDEALTQLEQEEPDGSELVKLVLFGGFSVEKAGTLLDMSRATAYRHWSYARAWLKTTLVDDP